MLSQWTYAAGQAARVAFFAGHHIAARRLGAPQKDSQGPAFKITKPRPSGRDFLSGMIDLFERDWSNIQAGLYASPPMASDPLDLLKRARAFMADVPSVDERRREHRHSDVLTEDRRQRYPRYYLQNFHYQTDGWLSEESARLYDFQVEALFAGTADAMRRQALAPIARALRGRDQRKLTLLDVACGTGRFLEQVKHNWPRLKVCALDLSPDYLARAAKTLAPWRGVEMIEANAEAMPLADEGQDIATCIYLFHELPPKTRSVVADEIVRVLKPGGMFVLVDSIQPGDGRGFEALMEFFPQAFHEPYYTSYLEWSAEEAFVARGLVKQESLPAFLSTVHVFSKPAQV
ncbi:MAG TPA: hypothetical protein DCL48_10385 [Alphaproteobacteria bacterium]|nr:hypothetical protein [Alphaproteobacteria bacterium]